MKCVVCGRRIKQAAATMPAQDAGPMPHPAGPVGPTCARTAGLIVATLFSKRRATTFSRIRKPATSTQLDLLETTTT